MAELELLERFIRLEDEVRELRALKVQKASEQGHQVGQDRYVDLHQLAQRPDAEKFRRSPTYCDQMTPNPASPTDVDAGIHTFTIGRCTSLSLAAQMETFKSMLQPTSHTPSQNCARSSDPRSKTERSSQSDFENFVRCPIPPQSRLFHLTRLFFDDFGYFYPCVYYDDYMSRLPKLLSHHHPGEDDLQIPANNAENISLAALMCMVMAIAEFLDGDVESTTGAPTSRGEGRLRQSKRLLKHHAQHCSANDDVIRIYALRAMYEVMRERFEQASDDLARAVNSAFALGLNNESTWPTGSSQQLQARRTLWWTIYYLDRRFGHRFGRSFLIRDVEVLVDEFDDDFPSVDVATGTAEDERMSYAGLPDDFSLVPSQSYYDDYWYHYLKFNVKWSRIFAKAWDALYSLNATAAGDPDEIEALEALLAKLKRQLPPELDWENSSEAEDEPNPACWERRARLKLIVFTVGRNLPLTEGVHVHARGRTANT